MKRKKRMKRQQFTKSSLHMAGDGPPRPSKERRRDIGSCNPALQDPECNNGISCGQPDFATTVGVRITTLPAAPSQDKAKELRKSFPAKIAKSMGIQLPSARSRCRRGQCSNKWTSHLGSRHGSITPIQLERRIWKNDKMRWMRPRRQKDPSTGSPCVAPPRIVQR